VQVLHGIQSGPYRNIYNPENFFIGQNGVGAGNNWGAGYAAGEGVQEEIFDMIDREADGSDSLEVWLMSSGIRVTGKPRKNITDVLGGYRDLCYYTRLPAVQAQVWAVTSWNE
jgi:hypothetical protein